MTSHRPVPPLLREQLRLGELPEDVAADVRLRLVGEQPPGGRSDEEILRAAPPSRFLAKVRRRSEPAPTLVVPVFRCSALLAVAAALLLFVQQPQAPGQCEDVRTKGEAMLSITQPHEIAPLAHGSTVQIGDQLQLAINAPCATSAVVYSVDTAGTVTEHQRFEEADSLAGPVPLARGFQLDDTPGFEAFHLVSGAELDIDAVLLDARHRGATEAPPRVPGAAIHTVVLHKDTP